MKHEFREIVEAKPELPEVFADLVRALDSMKKKELIGGQYFGPDESVCAWGALALYKNCDPMGMVGVAINHWTRIVNVNDAFVGSPRQRWLYMKEWALNGG